MKRFLENNNFEKYFDLHILYRGEAYYKENRILDIWCQDNNITSYIEGSEIYKVELKIEYYDEEELHISGEGRLFYEVKPFDEIIKVVKDLKRINISALDGIVEWFDELLHQYQYLTKFSDTRINRLCIILNRQINKLKNLIEEDK